MDEATIRRKTQECYLARPEFIESVFRAAITEAVAAEREACCRLVEDFRLLRATRSDEMARLLELTKAIRDRGEE